jgi:hypothetical protein
VYPIDVFAPISVSNAATIFGTSDAYAAKKASAPRYNHTNK